MNFTEAMRHMALGAFIRRTGCDTIVGVQAGTVPLLATGLMTRVPVVQDIGQDCGGNWFMMKFPVIVEKGPWGEMVRPSGGIPYAFSPGEVASTEWEVVK